MLPLLLGLQLAHTAPLGQLAKRNTLWADAVPQVHGLARRMELDFSPSSGRHSRAVTLFVVWKI